jgi:hypothetical protein
VAAKSNGTKVTRSSGTVAPREARRQVETGRRLADPGVAETIIAALRRGASVGVAAQKAGIAAKVLEDFLRPTIDAEKQMQMVLWSREPWRNEIHSRLTADIGPQVWDWIGALALNSTSPEQRNALMAADGNHSGVVQDARALVAELHRVDPSSYQVYRLRLRLHESLQIALEGANVRARVEPPRASDVHLVLVLRLMGLTLADLLPPRAQELRGSRADVERVESMGMVRRLREFLPPNTWALDAAGFERLADNHERVAQWYRNKAGPPPAAHRPAIRGNRAEMLRLAEEQGIGPGKLATMLARLGIAAPPAKGEDPQPFPSPTEARPTGNPRYLSENDYISAYTEWVKEQAHRHLELLKQVGRKKKARQGG